MGFAGLAEEMVPTEPEEEVVCFEDLFLGFFDGVGADTGGYFLGYLLLVPVRPLPLALRSDCCLLLPFFSLFSTIFVHKMLLFHCSLSFSLLVFTVRHYPRRQIVMFSEI